MELFDFDRNFKQNLVCGVDEAGRGPLAGPVVACAVILKEDAKNIIPDVNDSKKFSEKKEKSFMKGLLMHLKNIKFLLLVLKKLMK